MHFEKFSVELNIAGTIITIINNGENVVACFTSFARVENINNKETSTNAPVTTEKNSIKYSDMLVVNHTTYTLLPFG